MADEEPKSYAKYSISVRRDVAEKLEEIMQVTGLNTSGAFALAVKLLNLKKLKDSQGD